MHQVQHRQQLERLVRGLVFGGVGPGRAGGAIEGGEVFYGGGEFCHCFFLALFCQSDCLLPKGFFQSSGLHDA